jgi:uncharacterized protein DUF4157/transglycosylase-like protein with SLT domain
MQSGARLFRSDAKAPVKAGRDLPRVVHDVVHSAGRPLETATRASVERRFGHDFSAVRVHSDHRAAQSARAVDAFAYTVGRNVVFGPGNDRAAQDASSPLLAHELAHVIQYDRTGSLALHRRPAGPAQDDAVEHDADVIAAHADDVFAAKGGNGKKKPKKAAKPKRLTFAEVKSYVSANNKSTVSTDLLICLIWKESGFVPTDKNSSSSATGLMQVTKPAIADVNNNTPKGVHFTHGEMTDPAKNIACGTYYLQMRIDRAGSEAAGVNAYGTGSGYSTNIIACEACLGKAKTDDDATPCLEAIHT